MLKKKVISLNKLEEIKIQSNNYKFNTYRFDKNNKRVWNLINKSIEFRKLIQNKHVNKFMEWIFDRKTPHQKYFLSSFHANILGPRMSKAKITHRYPRSRAATRMANQGKFNLDVR